jgi:peptide/nickel transport system substrate-binding protein
MLPDATVSEAAFLRRNVKSIEVKGPYSVVVQLKQPDIFFRQIFNLESPAGIILPKDYYERVGSEEFSKRPIGSGPYKWHSQMLGSFIKLEATEKHWRDGIPNYKYLN